ncbi:MAG: Na+/H+ antiporter NhaC [Candidatus Methanohalarchaeum thermophilum]|uniref:Na+/H+ antiporter NhaC n=1 Tax=Methanohalarchaeum thermophilum TaxID=1903181 RepID=A0A1Q6DV08_METT1|nr:MAG: Na+/H+ antiporter NhaC [Candidatus Methanohalarchaeum thermophilum]
MPGAETFGFLSILPPVIAIVLAILTRRVLISLFIGIWFGGAIKVQAFADSTNILFGSIKAGALGFTQTADWIVTSLTSTWNMKILLFIMLLGPGTAFIWKTGGSEAIRRAASDKFDTPKGVSVLTWILGMLIFFDDYANSAIVGSAMKDISDKMRISKEKLSYIIDSTAAPISTFLLSTWVGYQLSMIKKGYEAAGITEIAPSTFSMFISSIPYNIYCILAVIMVGIIIITGRDYAEMLNAEHRSWTTGKVIADDDTPMQTIEKDIGDPILKKPMLRSIFIPIFVLISTILLGIWLTGYAEGRGLIEIFANASIGNNLLWGGFTMVFAEMALAIRYRILDFGEVMDTFRDGLKVMITAAAILTLAWSIGTTTSELGTAKYVVEQTRHIITPQILPIVIILSSAFIAFCTGSSWGTMAIVTPIAVPMAYETGNIGLIPAAVGSTFSGAIFGDHCSPISDTTVLSSIFSGADHIAHVRTQIYYASTVLVVTLLLYLVNGYTGISPVILIPIGILALIALVYILSELDSNRKGVPAKTNEYDKEKIMGEIRKK